MALYEITTEKIRKLESTQFQLEGIRERQDLQRLLKQHIESVAPDTLIISEEFADWSDSRRRIDLLGLDRQAKLVVFELKRSDTGSHMELQAIRYAAMVSTMTFSQCIDAYSNYAKLSSEAARTKLLEHLDWDEPKEDQFAKDVRIVLVAADFSKEITTAVLWLNDQGLDIRCVRFVPYKYAGATLIDIQTVIPLPEAEQYITGVKLKLQQEQVARDERLQRDFTKYDVTIDGKADRRLPKRIAMLRIVHALCKSGVSPKHIAEHLQWDKSSRPRFVSLPGRIAGHDFVERMDKTYLAQGKRFDPIRFFCDDDQLIYFEGSSYALSSQWGGILNETFQKLLALNPSAGIVVSVHDED